MKLSINHVAVGIVACCLYFTSVALGCIITLCPALSKAEKEEMPLRPLLNWSSHAADGLHKGDPARWSWQQQGVKEPVAGCFAEFHKDEDEFFDDVEQRSRQDLTCHSLVPLSQKSLKSRIVTILEKKRRKVHDSVPCSSCFWK